MLSEVSEGWFGLVMSRRNGTSVLYISPVGWHLTQAFNMCAVGICIYEGRHRPGGGGGGYSGINVMGGGGVRRSLIFCT